MDFQGSLLTSISWSHCMMQLRQPKNMVKVTQVFAVIRASLSEPHTSVTALQDACRCPVRPTIYRIFKLNERIRFCTHAKGLSKFKEKLALRQIAS